MIENSDFRIEEPDLTSRYDVDLIRRFLAPMGFYFDETTVEYCIILYTLNDDIVGVGSYQGKVLKYVAVAPQFRETGAFAHIVSYLTECVMQRSQQAFVFTKPDNIKRFEGIGYRHIASAQPLMSVLEFGYKGIDDYKKYLTSIKVQEVADKVAAIVMNGNPFTLGHQYLIEKASRENDLVYVFVVETERSVFSFQHRFEMIRAGVKHVSNVILVKGDEYIVSCATFPNYFLKNEKPDAITQKQAELDIEIFSRHIAPILQINRRYVGTETYCATTSLYNQVMKAILPNKGIDLIEVHRKEVNDASIGSYISASKVREAIRKNELQLLADYVPETTLQYLKKEMRISTIKQTLELTDSRH